MRRRELLYDTFVSSGQARKVAAIGDLAPRAAYFRRIVRDHFPSDRDAPIIDLGCGHGALLHFCSEAGYRTLEGVDVSADQVAVARRLGINGVRQGDLFAALHAAPDESYALIAAFDVLEHFTRDEVMKFLAEMRRTLRPGGKAIVHVPNGESPFVGTVLYGDFTHELAFTRRSLAQLAAAADFARVRAFEDRPVAHGFKSTVRAVLWPGVRLFFRFISAIETGDTGREAIFSRNFLAVLER